MWVWISRTLHELTLLLDRSTEEFAFLKRSTNIHETRVADRDRHSGSLLLVTQLVQLVNIVHKL